MNSGISRIYFQKKRNVSSFSITRGDITFNNGYYWEELTDIMAEGNLSTKSSTNPLVDLFELKASFVSKISDINILALKSFQNVFKVITKEGDALLLGAKNWSNTVTIDQELGESVGDFQGYKLTVEGCVIGSFPLLSSAIPTDDLDSKVYGFDSLFSAVVNFESYPSSSLGGYDSEYYSFSVLKDRMDISLKSHTAGIGFPAAMIHVKNYDTYPIFHKTGSFQATFDVDLNGDMDISLLKFETYISYIDADGALISQLTIQNVIFENGKATVNFDTPLDKYLSNIQIEVRNPASIGKSEGMLSIRNFILKLV